MEGQKVPIDSSEDFRKDREENHCFWRSLTLLLVSLLVLSSTLAWSLSVQSNLSNISLPVSNVTSYSYVEPDLLIFNRVPKAGTQTLSSLLSLLKDRNNFSAFTSLDDMPENVEGETTFVPDDAMRKLIINAYRRQLEATRPMVLLKHQNYMDFCEFEEASNGSQRCLKPLYINMVRHPVDRVISWYYYTRMPWYQVEITKNSFGLKSSIHNLRELKMSMEDCIADRHSGCFFPLEPRQVSLHHFQGLPAHVSQATFFCGHTSECDQLESFSMLQRAKKNVDENYSVVGVLESLESSLAVMEAFLPRYFRGVLDLYHSRNVSLNINTMKPNVEPWVRDFLEEYLANEIEFYNFCKRRLSKQLRSIVD